MAAVFLTRNRVKRVLHLSAAQTQHDDFIDDLLEPAEASLLNYMGLPFLTQTVVTETHDISGGQKEIAVEGPRLTAVAALTDSGSLVESSSYYIDEDTSRIVLSGSGSCFSAGYQKVVVTYTSGWSPVEERHIQAAAYVAAAMFNQGPHVGMRSEKMSGYTYTLAEDAIPAQAQALANEDRRIMPRRRYQLID